MRKTLLWIAPILLIGSAHSFAGASPSPCIPGNLASYVDLGSDGCTIDGTLLFNFAYEARPLGAAEIAATDITVTPGDSPFNQALNFAADWRVQPEQSQESLIKYNVKSLRRAPFQVSGLRLERGAGGEAGLFGTVYVDEFTSAGDLSINVRCTEVCRVQPSDSLEFTPVQSLRIVLDVKLRSEYGTFALSNFSAGVSEPSCVAGSADSDGCFESKP